MILSILFPSYQWISFINQKVSSIIVSYNIDRDKNFLISKYIESLNSIIIIYVVDALSSMSMIFFCFLSLSTDVVENKSPHRFFFSFRLFSLLLFLALVGLYHVAITNYLHFN